MQIYFSDNLYCYYEDLHYVVMRFLLKINKDSKS